MYTWDSGRDFAGIIIRFEFLTEFYWKINLHDNRLFQFKKCMARLYLYEGAECHWMRENTACQYKNIKKGHSFRILLLDLPAVLEGAYLKALKDWLVRNSQPCSQESKWGTRISLITSWSKKALGSLRLKMLCVVFPAWKQASFHNMLMINYFKDDESFEGFQIYAVYKEGVQA